eukprot:TRINITY_DN1236_c0_g1_i1.p1 TRINITY_DN1236_c0_g1~~TRINITY_DN1236_c0_g1_i1.p1  ORF type:complete len:283 (-),score=42.97 TRINITY_DN1236_c0_g1_i1:9-857(-)
MQSSPTTLPPISFLFEEGHDFIQEERFPFFINGEDVKKAEVIQRPIEWVFIRPISKTISELDQLQQQEEKSFLCQWRDCRESFITKTGLATHIAQHLIIDPTIIDGVRKKRGVLVCEWDDCQQHFTGIKDICRHLSEEDHIGQAPCFTKEELCSFGVGRPFKKRKHTCSYAGCGKMFSDTSNKKKHERTHQVIRERFHCTERGCEKSYSTKTDLKIHIKTHKGIYPHRCSFESCRKGFIRLSELLTHEMGHDNIVNCSKCGKRIRDKTKLQKHQSCCGSHYE